VAGIDETLRPDGLISPGLGDTVSNDDRGSSLSLCHADGVQPGNDIQKNRVIVSSILQALTKGQGGYRSVIENVALLFEEENLFIDLTAPHTFVVIFLTFCSVIRAGSGSSAVSKGFSPVSAMRRCHVMFISQVIPVYP